MKKGVIFALVILILSALFISGCEQQQKQSIGYSTSDCERVCNTTYNDTPERLESCWNSCKDFGTKGDAYSKYMESLDKAREEAP
jgi:hypothetical protein